MARTTLDIDLIILRELKKVQKEEGRTLGQIVSGLLAEALGQRKKKKPPKPRFQWKVHDFGGPPLVDIEDKEALWAMWDEEQYGHLHHR